MQETRDLEERREEGGCKKRKGNSAFERSGSGVKKRVERRSGFEGIEIKIMIAS